jgi:amino acid adenylation domain-containing protein
MPRDDSIHEAVHANAVARPAATAVVHAGGVVTYGELDLWSDKLAAAMAEAGVRAGTIVPVLLPPSPLLVIVLLAVLKCGAAYSALDRAWPATRLRRILDLLPGQLAVTGRDTGALAAGQRIVVADDLSVVIDAVRRPPRIVAPTGDAAMVFFTSGSTGEPKAVLSPHRATTRLFDVCTFGRFDSTTVMPQAAAVPWDAFALELWGPLMAGGTCVLVTARPMTPDGLRQAVAAHDVTTVFLTTSLFHLFVEEDVAAFTGLDTVIVGGERMSPAHARDLLAAVPNLRLVNGYGPVESTVFALTHDVRPQDTVAEIPLGRPVSRTRVLVLRRNEPLGDVHADDEVGEICVAGDGLAIGYLGDAALTAEKFPTVSVDGVAVRVYRTGDLGHRAADGVIHFHGRQDRQVKVRGNRIEPAGIERVAAGVPGVRRCVVAVPRDDTGNATGLLMFYLPTKGHPSEPELTAALRTALPGYAVPDRIIALERFPLSANGKVDTGRLLAETGGPVPGTAPPGYAVPGHGGDTASVVTAEVAALLGITDVDPTASVFSLGGTSMTAVRLCSRLSRRFGRAVPISRLMGGPTVGDLVAWLDTPEPAAASAGVSSVADLARGVPVTPMQQSFVLQELRARDGQPTNHCLLRWTITGALDPDRLAAAVRAVHRHHDSLHARFDVGDEVLALAADPAVEITRHTAADQETATRLVSADLGRPFDLMTGPLWRAVLVADRGRGCWLFGVAVHHAVFDGWSEHLLARDISLAYDRRLANVSAAPALAEVRRSLAEVVRAVDLPAQRTYWTAELAGLRPVAWPSPTARDDTGPRWLEYPLGDELMARVADEATRCGTTTLAIVLDAVGRGLFAHTVGDDDIGVGVPVSLRGTEVLQRPVGCLVDTVCVRLRRAGHSRVTTTAATAGAMANVDLPFAEVVRVARPPRVRRHPLYQVIAAVQDSPAPVLRLAGARTELHRKDDLPWSDIELVVELCCAPGDPPRLRVTRDPTVVDMATFTALAEDILDALGSAGRPA